MALTRDRSVAKLETSPYRHQLSSLKSSQKSSYGSTQSLGPASEKSATVCSAVRLALQEPLTAVYLKISDTSCAKLQYRLLGTKRYWYRSVEQDEEGKKCWEVKFYQTNCRKSKLEMLSKCTWLTMPRLTQKDVALKSLGTFATEKAALSALDAAVQVRDVTNPFTGLSCQTSAIPLGLVKYFHVVIVSDQFQGKLQNERLDLIYRLLVNVNPSPTTAAEARLLSRQPDMLWPTTRSRVRGLSTISENVIALSMWKSLSCHFTICAKTSTQWRDGQTRAKIERLFTKQFVLGHFDSNRTNNVDEERHSVSREVVSLTKYALRSKHATKSMPRFYNELPDDAQRRIAEKQGKMTQDRANLITVKEFTNTLEAAFVQKYNKRRREYVLVALQLQRLYRSNMHTKTLRRCFLRHVGAMALQRLFRGHQQRKVVKAYLCVATCAVLTIQSVYRSYKFRLAIKAMLLRYQQATLSIQRLYRDFVSKKHAKQERQINLNAIMIEKVVKGFLGRRRAQRISLAKYRRKVVFPACLLIQRIWRGCRDRKIMQASRQIEEWSHVLLPAARRIEALIRGFLARQLVKKLLAYEKAARRMQRLWCCYKYSKEWRIFMEMRREDRMASRIGMFARRYLARKYMQCRKQKWTSQHVLDPSAVRIQCVFRGYFGRKRLDELSHETEAAITLQQMWRSTSRIKMIQKSLQSFRMAHCDSAARKLQQCYRCCRARRELTSRRLSYLAYYGKAALVVQSAWRSYCSRKKLEKFRFCSIIERKATLLTKSKDDRETIESDVLDTRADLRRLVKCKAKTLRRIKELKAMRYEWEQRQPVLEKELDQLSESEKTQGWNEALVTEKHNLSLSLGLNLEDISANIQQGRDYDEEIEQLRIEMEDLEREMEECITNETMELESYRELEVQRAGAMFAEERTRKVRLQRIRWGTRNNRKHFILRKKKDLQALHANRQVDELSALAFKKKQWYKRKLTQSVADAAMSSAQQNNVAMRMKCDPHVLKTFDDAIHIMQKNLAGMLPSIPTFSGKS